MNSEDNIHGALVGGPCQARKTLMTTSWVILFTSIALKNNEHVCKWKPFYTLGIKGSASLLPGCAYLSERSWVWSSPSLHAKKLMQNSLQERGKTLPSRGNFQMSLQIDKAVRTNSFFPSFPHAPPFFCFLLLREFSHLNLSNSIMLNEAKRLKVVAVQTPTSIPQTSLKLGRKKKNSYWEKTLSTVYSSSTNYQFASVMWEDAYKELHGQVLHIHFSVVF